MGVGKWFRRCGEKIAYRFDERRLKKMGLRRVRGEREYPRQPGSIDGIAADHLERYDLAMPHCLDKTVLDYGCGVGYGSFALSQVAKQVMGYDISRDALDWASHYTDRSPNLWFISELPEEEFDCITCFECIEHVPNPEEVLDWLAAHATQHVFVSTPDASAGVTKNDFHLREFTREEFRELLNARFEIEEETTQHGPHSDVMIFRCRPV